MTKLFYSFALLAFFSISLDSIAGCRGCCSGHGGVVCLSDKNRCADGTAMSVKCESKSCNKCSSGFSNEKQKAVKGKKYKRSYFKHWKDYDHDCQNTRAELLIEKSIKPVQFRTSKKCLVSKGKWDDFFFSKPLLLASKIDIDHVVPLKHAWLTGARFWSKRKRETFANDKENLVITDRVYNRTKGAKSIAEWLPMNKEYSCRYIKKWFQIKRKYNLLVMSEEKKTRDLLKCK